MIYGGLRSDEPYSRNVDIAMAYTDPHADLLFNNFFFDFVSPGESYPGPDNKAVIMNNITQLECRDFNQTGAIWQFTRVESKKDITIYWRRELQEIKDRNHYHLIHNPENGQYDLIINSTKIEDAGVYTCLLPGNDYKAQLIVLGEYKTSRNYYLLDHFCLSFI